MSAYLALARPSSSLINMHDWLPESHSSTQRNSSNTGVDRDLHNIDQVLRLCQGLLSELRMNNDPNNVTFGQF